MEEHENNFFTEKFDSADEAFGVIERLHDIAKPKATFSEPVSHGEYSVITGSEVIASIGAGYGGGGGQSSATAGKNPEATGYGGGGGGGGFVMSRPVVVITIGPDGTKVEPVIDPTKIAIAFFTTFTAMVMTLIQVVRFKNRKS